MSFTKKFFKFCNENVVLISGVGIIIGIHWMWDRLQHVPYLVPEKDRKEIPLIQGAMYLESKVAEEISNLKANFKEDNSKTSQD